MSEKNDADCSKTHNKYFYRSEININRLDFQKKLVSINHFKNRAH